MTNFKTLEEYYQAIKPSGRPHYGSDKEYLGYVGIQLVAEAQEVIDTSQFMDEESTEGIEEVGDFLYYLSHALHYAKLPFDLNELDEVECLERERLECWGRHDKMIYLYNLTILFADTFGKVLRGKQTDVESPHLTLCDIYLLIYAAFSLVGVDLSEENVQRVLTYNYNKVKVYIPEESKYGLNEDYVDELDPGSLAFMH